MKICFNDNEIRKARGQWCNTCSLRFHSNPCVWLGICGNDSALVFEYPSEIFKL